MATPPVYARMAPYSSNKQLLAWDRLPDDEAVWPEIRRLRLMQRFDERPSFPTSIYHLKGLQEIDLPIDFAENLHPEEWTNQIAKIDFDEREGGCATIPATLTFRRCEALSCCSSELLFDATSFPNLKSLQFKWSKRKHERQEFQIESLEELHLVGIPNLDAIARSEWGRLRTLGLVNSQMTSLDGISGTSNTLKLRFKNLSKVDSLEPLGGLKSLRHLDIQYCSKIMDLAPVIHHPSIEQVRLICSRIDFEPWRETIMNGRFQSFSATGPNYFYLSDGEWKWSKKRGKRSA